MKKRQLIFNVAGVGIRCGLYFAEEATHNPRKVRRNPFLPGGSKYWGSHPGNSYWLPRCKKVKP